MSNKIENVEEFTKVLENITKFMDSTSVMIKVKDNSISQHSSGKTFFYEFSGIVPDFTCYNAVNLLFVIKTLTEKSKDVIILPSIIVEEDFIKIVTIDDGMKLPLADDGMIDHEGDYKGEIADIDTAVDLSKVIERLSKLSGIAETNTIRLSIGEDDVVTSIETTNDMTKASYKKILVKSKNSIPFDFSKDFFITLNGLKEYETLIDVDRLVDYTPEEDEDMDDAGDVCSLIASIPIIKEDDEERKLFIFIENEEDIMK